MNPPIPTRPCARCGIPTNETQSVHGVMHAECFKATQPADDQDFLSGVKACDITDGTCEACQ